MSKTVLEMAKEAGFPFNKFGLLQGDDNGEIDADQMLERLVELARADEREAISDKWSMCIQSDLEHGVKWANEQAAKDWFKNYPEIAKFGAWLSARSNT